MTNHHYKGLIERQRDRKRCDNSQCLAYEQLESRLLLSGVSFTPHLVFGNESPRGVFAADMDNDGDADVLFASHSTNKIAWHENLDGEGMFSTAQTISESAAGAFGIHVADLDGDGDLDVLSASYLDDKIAWYENTDGQSAFGPQRVITTEADGANSVFAADVDGDGDMDVLSTSWFGKTAVWYENLDGHGNFGLGQLITSDAADNSSAFGADLDGDGDADVLVASNTDSTIGWYENTDGQGSFGSRLSIATGVSGARAAVATDVDRDGDLDVVSAGSDKVAWYENANGQGAFGGERVISTEVSGASSSSLFAADLDGDGDVDVLSAGRGDGKIAWYENVDGQGNFGPQKVLAANAEGARSVFAADLDGDGDLDVLSAVQEIERVAWYENTDGDGSFGPTTMIPPLEGSFVDRPDSVFAADIDGDGDMDVVSGARNGIAWHENSDGLGDSEPHIISTKYQAYSIVAADVDGDGDLDVLSASISDGLFAWYENIDGQGAFGPERVIFFFLPINTHRVDGDGDLDVLSFSEYAGTNYDGGIHWYENLDGAGNFAAGRVIPRNSAGIASLIASDLDGDGDVDLLIAAHKLDQVAWFENTDGQGNFSAQNAITLSPPLSRYPNSVFAADLDGDGDEDVMASLKDDNSIVWYENADGRGTFGPQRIITTQAPWATSVFAADMDGDGDMDLVSGSSSIAWHENLDGLGNFGMRQVIAYVEGDVQSSVFATDVDGDGNVDVVAIWGSGVAWYRNTDGLGNFGPQRLISTDISADEFSVFASDVDGDSDMDVLITASSVVEVAWYENTDGNGSFGPLQLITDNDAFAKSVIATDIDTLVADIAASVHTPELDMTGDGLVDLADRDAWLATAGAVNLPSGNAYLLGDANLDGGVDVSDFMLWNNHRFTANAAWSAGDFNADGVVDVSDFMLWNNHKFTSAVGVLAAPIGSGARLNRLAGPVLDSRSDRSEAELELQDPLKPLRRTDLGIDRGRRQNHEAAIDQVSLDAALAEWEIAPTPLWSSGLI